MATLARWLGPWSRSTPSGVCREERPLATPAGAVRTWRYAPRDGVVSGAILVVPGLHPSGPADVRMDRFCRILAASGLRVVAPFVRPQLDLVVSARSANDVALALGELARECRTIALPPPAMMSISFGCLPALTVAANPSHRRDLAALILFGGYADFEATVRFALTGRAFDGTTPLTLPHDPLNTPALFINLLPHLEVAGDPARLHEAWLEMARRTWGRPELRPAERRRPIAEALAATLAEDQRSLFRIGCGLAEGGAELLEQALARGREALRFADPRPHLSALRVPVLVAHGRDDDVIPWNEARKLAGAVAPSTVVRVAITGLFGHTGAVLPSPHALASELGNLSTLLRGLVDAPRGGFR